MSKRAALSVWALALSILAGGCASTSGAVPHPFPMPATAATAPLSAPAAVDVTASRAPLPAASSRALIDTYALVGTALDLRGVPYRNGGSDPKGFDCSGFTQYVFAQYNVGLPRDVREQFKLGTVVGKGAVEPGDLLFFATTSPDASHVAIAVGGDQFVHAPSSTGVVRVERLDARYWAERYLGARRVTQP